MKRFARLFALALAGIMMFALLTGCSADDTVTSKEGEKMIAAYLDSVNFVRSEGTPTLENDEELKKLCRQFLEDNIDPDTGLAINLNYSVSIGPDPDTGLFANINVTIYGSRVSEESDNYFAAEITPAYIQEQIDYYHTYAEEYQSTFDHYTAVGIDYVVIGGKTYAAYASKSVRNSMPE